MLQKKLIAGVAVLLIMAAAVIWQLSQKDGPSASSALWQERADEAQLELAASFWDEKRSLFNNAAPCIAQLCTDPFNYWWLAHAVDVLVDGYERTDDKRFTEQIAKLYQGLLDRNAGVMINDYYDDMEWMALAWLRAYDATKDERYKQASLDLWEEIKGGWNDEMGGGIAWRKEQIDYKNTPANAPAVILAARLYGHFHNEEDLEWAKKIYDWQKKTLVDPETGLVWDGINRTGDGNIDKDWQFTYGQGVYIGAGTELYRATEEQAYLEDARLTAANLKNMFLTPATGMLPSEGEGDGGLFKGVLVRYLGELIAADPGNPKRKELIGMLKTNADSLWQYGKAEDKALFSYSWTQTPDAVVQLSTELSGIMLLEQMAVLEKNGQLD
ncbi:Predicted alpha-1,6-mannanase, GH76 family [Paenibacillus catalpae]|uniref:Predicted alpha-1,6-mannanase, GH76 family n=1 Tax=Paenibacillus catalpae TaxID=1045775 RepID=A0A1I1XUJ0_9BACL|nr:glycoside hydrolase family 76 protein [Paenibacillus catalpae]SFE11015.1 Predicted alpha-1,6-mannanase, GH76 family [Paenibacillus catalpae]